jgi:hypothetical protein
MIELPQPYKTAIRDWVRFGLWGILVGMLLGIWWTDVRKRIKYAAPGEGAELRQLADDGEVLKTPYVRLPPGVHWEAGMKLKLSHGHVILITGCLPFCFALGIFLVPACGGRPMSPGLLKSAFWCYAIGSLGAVAIMVYRGQAGFSEIQGGNFDFAAIEAGLFGGSRALKGAAYGITHTLLAVGCGILIHQLWKGVGGIVDAPVEAAAPEPAPTADAEEAPADSEPSGEA